MFVFHISQRITTDLGICISLRHTPEVVDEFTSCCSCLSVAVLNNCVFVFLINMICLSLFAEFHTFIYADHDISHCSPQAAEPRKDMPGEGFLKRFCKIFFLQGHIATRGIRWKKDAGQLQIGKMKHHKIHFVHTYYHLIQTHESKNEKSGAWILLSANHFFYHFLVGIR